MAVSRSRILDLMKVSSSIFSTTFNPTNVRTGNKILRQRLKGPAVAAYYPQANVRMKDFRRMFPGYETYDDGEEDRLESLQVRRMKGKGAPKKKKTKEESKKFRGRKPAGAAKD